MAESANNSFPKHSLRFLKIKKECSRCLIVLGLSDDKHFEEITKISLFHPLLKTGKSAFISNVVYPRCSNLMGLFIVPVALGATFREIKFGLPVLSSV
jgi:hypothetical protein